METKMVAEKVVRFKVGPFVYTNKAAAKSEAERSGLKVQRVIREIDNPIPPIKEVKRLNYSRSVLGW
jgi:hypothetical protein